MPALKQADILFGQLECNLARTAERQMQAYHARRVRPEKASALVAAGFDVISLAGNHALDLGEPAFLETIDTLRNNNIAVIGAGRNIEEARKPFLIERNGTRVAFLSYCSVLPKGYEAGPDKPGCAPLRITTFYEQIDWQPGTPPRIVTVPDKQDVAAMLEDIGKTRLLADVVILSLHWGVHFVPKVLATYQKEIAHAAIDAGVDLIVGHHPHLLKAIEVYKGKVIFYSLGNFVAPSSRDRKSEGRVHYGVTPDPDYPHYPYPPEARKTAIAKCVISSGRIGRVSYLPALINKAVQPEALGGHDPRFAEVRGYLDDITRSQGMTTRFVVEGDEVAVSAS